MARKSDGQLPAVPPIAADANQAILHLNRMYHWSATKINRDDNWTVCVTITHAGKRVSAERKTFIDAVNAAMTKLQKSETPYMRIAR